MKNRLLQLISIFMIVFFTVALTPSGGPIGPLPPSDVAYNAATWNGSYLAPTQNAVRDQIVAATAAAATDDFITTGAISGAILVGTEITANTSLSTAQMNRWYTVSAACEVTLPDDCDSATGTWVGLTIKDDSEKLEVALTDGSDQFIFLDGTELAAGNEIDSLANANSGGDHITLYCQDTNVWRTKSENGTFADGGVAD